MEVTNSSGNNQKPLEIENVQLTSAQEHSTDNQAPYAAKLIFQSNIAINPVKYLVRFDHPIQLAALPQFVFMGNLSPWGKDKRVLIVIISTPAEPPLSPERPLVLHVKSAEPIRVAAFEKYLE